MSIFTVTVKRVQTEVGYIKIRASSQKEAESIVRADIRAEDIEGEDRNLGARIDVNYGEDSDKRWVVPL
jgi:hypothetical protein